MKNSSSNFQRHGDMLIQRVTNPEKLKELKKKRRENLPIGLGEVTGHAHNIKPFEGGEVIEIANENELAESNSNFEASADRDRVYFEVTGNGALVHHEEHEPQIIEPGIYTRVIQKSYSVVDETSRRVRD